MDNDFYTLFSRFWWLIFPLFWMGVMVMAHWSRHARANRALDIVKIYADQGKDPPPELLKSLQGGTDGYCAGGGRYSPARRLHRTILFSALALAFGVLTFWNYGDSGNWRHSSGLLIPAVIFAALAFSNFVSLMLLPRGLPPDDRHGR